MTITVRPLQPSDVGACEDILRSLPDFFGHEGGLASAFQAIRSGPGWVALHSGRVVGFATWEQRTGETAEITWMAVHRDHRHRGIGTAILETAVAEPQERGYRLALAITSGVTKDGEDTYVPTRQFWKAQGFLPVIELDIWDTNLALLHVRPL